MKKIIDWNIQYDCLVEWLSTTEYVLIEKWGAQDFILFDDKEIIINSQYKPENKFYTLLHECGHLITNRKKKSFLDKYPLYPIDVSDRRIVKGVSYKVSLIGEELKAWERGLALAKKLKLFVNKKNYHKCMTDSIWTYIQYVSDNLNK